MPSRARGRVETWPTFGEAGRKAARREPVRELRRLRDGIQVQPKFAWLRRLAPLEDRVERSLGRGLEDPEADRSIEEARRDARSEQQSRARDGFGAQIEPGRCRGVGVDHCARLDRVREAAAFVGIELHAGFVAGSVRPRLPGPSVAAFTSRVSSIAPKRCDSASSKPTSPMKRSGLRNVPQSMSQIGRSL